MIALDRLQAYHDHLRLTAYSCNKISNPIYTITLVIFYIAYWSFLALDFIFLKEQQQIKIPINRATDSATAPAMILPRKTAETIVYLKQYTCSHRPIS